MSGADKLSWQLAKGRESLAPMLLDLRKNFANSGSTIYSARNELKRVIVGDLSLIVKSFGIPNLFRQQIYGRLRKSKARKSYENAQRLAAMEICTPRAVGFIEYYRSGRIQESFFVSEEWPATCTIREVLLNPDFPSRSGILSAFGEFSWNLHRQHVCHRDFSPGNILIRVENQQPIFCLVDVNRVTFSSISLKQRMANFAMLWANDQDLTSIIKAYVAVSGDDQGLAMKVAQKQSRQHRVRAQRKESIKTMLGLH